MKPDASKHDPRPEYLRALIARTGLSQRQVADRIGVTDRMMRYYLADPQRDARYVVAPYSVQYAIERLAALTRRR